MGDTGRAVYSNANGCARFIDVQTNRHVYVQGYWYSGVASSLYHYAVNTDVAYAGIGSDPTYTVSGVVYGPYPL